MVNLNKKMTISGFTMVKNAGKLYYPLKESILSILPIVDEYIIALGNCDEDDNTLEIINSINSSKIKIIHTTWDTQKYTKGSILAQQTDFAKEHCGGQWLIYLQADEVIHEKDHQTIIDSIHKHLQNHDVEGLVFRYLHFWGDYSHVFYNNHEWYRNEIRIIRNRPEIHSWRDAQSFRWIPDFSPQKYLIKEGTRKLNVAKIDVHIYHYGWVRPPKLMGKKITKFINCYRETNEVISHIEYGPLGKIPLFAGNHPNVMADKIASFNWEAELNYSKKRKKHEPIHKHNKLKYRFLSSIERLFFPDGLFVFKNYNVIK